MWSELVEACFNHNHEEAAYWLALAGPTLLDVSYYTCCRTKQSKLDVAALHGGKLGTVFANLAWALNVVTDCLSLQPVPGPQPEAPGSLPEAYKPLQTWLQENPELIMAHRKFTADPLFTWHSWSCLLGVVGKLYEQQNGASPCCGVKVLKLHDRGHGRMEGLAMAVPVDVHHPRIGGWMQAILANLTRFYVLAPGRELVTDLVLQLLPTTSSSSKHQQQAASTSSSNKHQQQQADLRNRPQPQHREQLHQEEVKPQQQQPIEQSCGKLQYQSSYHRAEQVMHTQLYTTNTSRSSSTDTPLDDTSSMAAVIQGSCSSSSANSAANMAEASSSRSSSSSSVPHEQAGGPAEGLVSGSAGGKQPQLSSPSCLGAGPRVGWLYSRELQRPAASSAADVIQQDPLPASLKFKIILELLLLVWPPAAEADGSMICVGNSSNPNASNCVGDEERTCLRGGADAVALTDSYSTIKSSSSSRAGVNSVPSSGQFLATKQEPTASAPSSSSSESINCRGGHNDSARSCYVSAHGVGVSSSPGQQYMLKVTDKAAATSSSSSTGSAVQGGDAEEKEGSDSGIGSCSMGPSGDLPEPAELLCSTAVWQQRFEWLLLLLAMLEAPHLKSQILARQFNLKAPAGSQLLQLLYHALLQDGKEHGRSPSGVSVFNEETGSLLARALDLGGSDPSSLVSALAEVVYQSRTARCLQQLSMPDLVTLVLQSLLYVVPEGVGEEVCNWMKEGKMLMSGKGEQNRISELV